MADYGATVAEPNERTAVESEALIREARERWTRAADAEQAQRKSILLAKQFRAGDQWPADIKLAREGAASIQGQPQLPARPCLVVDRLSQPVRQVSNTIKQAEFGFDVSSNSEDASDDVADLFKGYLRRMLAQSRGESPVEWAADGAIEAGLGWFRLRADYVAQTWDGQPDDSIFDQELKMERITNSLSVYCDPSAWKPTRCDAQWMFVTEDLSRDGYKVLYGEDDIQSLDDYVSVGDPKCKDWVTNDSIRVAEYWHIDYTARYFHQLENGRIIEGEKKAPAGAKQSRVLMQPKVTCSIINAVKVIREYDWKGSYIPIIPILGEELNVDGQPVLRGVIQEGQDAQRMVNYTYSGAMEIFALAPKTPWIAAEGQIDTYKAIWENANIYNFSVLPYTPVDLAGNLLPAPQRQASEPPIQAAAMLMKISEEAIKATTSVGDPSLGNTNPVAHSGRAIQALQGQSDLANSNYPDNVRRALIYAGELAMEVIPRITRKGQLLHILGVDDEVEKVLAGVPFTQGQNGHPQAVPNMTPELAKLSKGLVKFYDLNAGRYAVTVTVGKAQATKREEGAAALGELIPHLPPEMAAVATVDYVKQLSFTGAEKIAEKLQRVLPPQLQDQPEGGIPPQLQSMLQGLQQQLQQAQQIIQTDQAKTQGQVMVAQAKAEGDAKLATLKHQQEMELQQMKDANAIAVARIQAAKAALDAQAEMQEERLSTGLQMAHEVGMTAMDQQHEREMATQAHQQALAANAQQAQQQSDLAAQQAGHAQEAQAQAAEQQQAAAEQAAQQQPTGGAE